MNTSRRDACHLGDALNRLSVPPGEYGRKIKTQRNRRGPAQVVEHVFNSKIREEPYLALTLIEHFRDRVVPFGEHENRCCTAVVSSCREMLG